METTLVRKREGESTGKVAGNLRLERRQDGRLWLVRPDGRATLVRVNRCFPWSHPGQYLSLLDGDDEEVGMVRDPAELNAESRRALEDELVEAGFVFEITGVAGIVEEVEIRAWTVTTRQGQRSFQTRLDDWPRELPGGGLLIRDVAGDLYRLEDPNSLDKKSRELLWAFVD